MLDHVVDDTEEIVVTRSGRDAAVIISLREYESPKETAYLMASPANAHRCGRWAGRCTMRTAPPLCRATRWRDV